MKQSPLQRIESLITTLPGKDAELAKKYFKERNFEYILELVKSDLYKANKAKRAQKVITEVEDLDESIASLLSLEEELILYMSYLDIDLSNYDD
jgi:hypothetical protein